MNSSRYERNWNECIDDTISMVTSNEYLNLSVTLVEVDELFKFLSVANIASFVPTIHGISFHTKRRPHISNPKYFAYAFGYLLQIFFLNTSSLIIWISKNRFQYIQNTQHTTFFRTILAINCWQYYSRITASEIPLCVIFHVLTILDD